MFSDPHTSTTEQSKRPRRVSGSFSHGIVDCIIVGAGAAGLVAGIYTARRGLSTIIIGADLGGQTASTAEIENYPGCGVVEGPDLIGRFFHEAQQFGCTFLIDDIRLLEKDGDGFVLSSSGQQYRSRTVIIATGKSPRRLGVPGEEDFIGKGIVYGGAFDASEYDGKRVAIVGGGNSAMDAVTRLFGHASHLTSIHRRDSFAGEKVLLDRVAGVPQLNRLFGAHVTALTGSHTLEALVVQTSSGEQRTLPVDVVVVAIGFESRNEWVADIVPCTDDKHIITDAQCLTRCEGVFAAGDCTTVPYQQIVISAGEGAKAAISAYHYLAKKEGKRALQVDWGYIKTQN